MSTETVNRLVQEHPLPPVFDIDTGDRASLHIEHERLSDDSYVYNLWLGKYLVVYCRSLAHAEEAKEAIGQAIRKAAA